MFSETSIAGLRLVPFKREYKDKQALEPIQESLTWQWELFEHLPFRRLTYGIAHEDHDWAAADGWIHFEILALILWQLIEALPRSLWSLIAVLIWYQYGVTWTVYLILCLMLFQMLPRVLQHPSQKISGLGYQIVGGEASNGEQMWDAHGRKMAHDGKPDRGTVSWYVTRIALSSCRFPL